ncbi:MAG: hypothetical protein DID92_2727743557 [Candidatus Nitrotoga sp. SPKER]|nr:MAG: hypothetical protein DID92_2727743557 [Candidatus Nitrotoga sp. SPKER]
MIGYVAPSEILQVITQPRWKFDKHETFRSYMNRAFINR